MTNQDIDRISAAPLNFVIGKGRSGTTLLQGMFNSHPNIVAPPESRFIILLQLKYGSIKSWREKDIRSFCNDLFSEKLFREFWQVDKAKLYASLIEVKDKLNYFLLCKLVFCQFAQPRKEISMFVDKNPLYCYYVPELIRIFPNAKFVHIVRDYRANIFSHKRVAIRAINIYDIAYKWRELNKRIEKNKKEFPDKWLMIKYEMLVTDPEGSMKQICSFFNITYDGNMLMAHKTRSENSFYKKVDGQFAGKFQKRVFEPISSLFVNEWKEKMSKENLAIANSIAGEYAEKTYGYKVDSENNDFHISNLRMFSVKFKYMLIILLYKSMKYRWVYYVRSFFVKYFVLNLK